jgi:hypothetical protein
MVGVDMPNRRSILYYYWDNGVSRGDNLRNVARITSGQRQAEYDLGQRGFVDFGDTLRVVFHEEALPSGYDLSTYFDSHIREANLARPDFLRVINRGWTPSVGIRKLDAGTVLFYQACLDVQMHNK